MPRRPGITFETATPPVPDALPRMDVAGFVGFATRGPIDRPVPVEDLDRFRDVFGPPLDLVEEAGSGRTRTAHLHRAVEAFFRNGGRRCWVVRVARSKTASTEDAPLSEPVARTSFPLPGVISASSGRPTTVRARCFGATFDGLQVGTVLRRRLLPTPSTATVRDGGNSDGKPGLKLSWAVEARDVPGEGDLTIGDLLRLRMVKADDGSTGEEDRFSKETALVAYAPLTSVRRKQQGRATDSPPSGERNGRVVTVHTGPIHVFRRVPDRLALSPEQKNDETEVSIPETREVGVDVQVQSASGAVADLSGATLIREIGPSYDEEDPPRFFLVVDRSEIPGGQGRVGLKSQCVHVFDASGDRFGYLRLGRAGRSDDNDLKFEVRDALWPVSNKQVGGVEPGGDWSVVEAEQLAFDLLGWREQELHNRLNRLGFADAHPRAWTDLPVDEELFELEHGEAVSPESGTLRGDVFDPRFPLAAPASPGAEASGPTLFVPLGMADRPDPDRTAERISPPTERARLEKERVPTFSPAVFVDDDLAGTRTSTLQQKADDKIYLRDEPTTGLHSLWSISEVTLLAVPDAVHRGWRTRTWIEPTPAPTPAFATVDVQAGTEPPYVELGWAVENLGEGDVEVQVQEATEPTFTSPVVRYRGSEASVQRFVQDTPTTLYFRFRVLVDGTPGGWSETRRVDVPDPDFTPCSPSRPPVPDAELYVDGDQRWWLRWEPVADPQSTDVEYEVQVDTVPTFGAPTTVTGEDTGTENPFLLRATPPDRASLDDDEDGRFGQEQFWYDLGLPSATPAVRHVRIRARRTLGDRSLHGPWTRTLTIDQLLQQERPLISKEEYNDPQKDTPGRGRDGLYDVHRAMLRFAAARKDVLSVLSLPETDQVDDARRHATRLRTPGSVLEPQEETTLSYGALYYPWLLSPVDDDRGLVPTPPDGAACGTVADRTLRDGAWMAPANIPLDTVRSVVPPLASGEPAALADQNVNVFEEGPRGIRTLTATTLTRDPDLEPIATRRLLILVRRLAVREGPELVFENNTPLLRRRIAEQFDDLLRRLFERGAFAGARPSEGYRVVTDASVNPPEQVERGRLVVELRIAPSRPLKFLTVRLVQRGNQTAVTGEASV